jgi:hypothetical protein
MWQCVMRMGILNWKRTCQTAAAMLLGRGLRPGEGNSSGGSQRRRLGRGRPEDGSARRGRTLPAGSGRRRRRKRRRQADRIM